jgi:fido (protein-threonine AMPylation protein)
MARVSNKKEQDILEERGLWMAAVFLHKLIERLKRKKSPLEINYIKQAHGIIFNTAKQPEIAGIYRKENSPELERVDGTPLRVADWKYIPTEMANLNFELKEQTVNIKRYKTKGDLRRIIFIAAKLSHRLASIHPFYNGNGRASRLLLNSILKMFDLPEIAIKKTKIQYLWAMRHADDGNFQTLEHIIKESLRDVFKGRVAEMKKRQVEEIKSGHHLRKRKSKK